MTCEQCKDEAWINIAHPVRPGVIIWRVPCDLCNADGKTPDPWPPAEFTISVDDGTIEGLNANTTTTVGVIDAGLDRDSEDDC